MQETKGLLTKMRHHNKLPITMNENCKIHVPQDILDILKQPHKLGFYYFVFMDQGHATYQANAREIPLTDSQMVFGFPNQEFYNPPKSSTNLYNNFGFEEDILALLPQKHSFLLNPLNTNIITFDAAAKQRVKSIFSILFQLIHSPEKHKNTEIILAYLNILFTEFNKAYFQDNDQEVISNSRLSKYIAFKLAVESQLTEQHDVYTIAEKLSTTTSTLYGIVKEFSGHSPKEWITNRLVQEAQRKLQYSNISAKELAYELGFNDPAYFSRLFKKNTGKTVSAFIAGIRDLSH
jgi:AraC-like DNA-binding protein